jgi:NAD(P)H-nitrite reductase large subunit
MALPYWLAGNIPRGQVMTGDDDYFKRLGVDARLSARVKSIDPKANRLSLVDGASIEFDDLLIATGSSPVVPSIEGTDLTGVHTLWTLADTEKVLKAVEGIGRPKVVMIGAGFIGFIVLNAMFKRGWNLTVVEREAHVLPRMLDADAAAHVESWLASRGVAVHTGANVSGIHESAGKKSVELADGKKIEADVVIIATGVRPNIDLLDGSGIETDHGILINDRCQTNFPYIYAAGDVAQGPNLLGSQPEVHAIQPTAVDHGRVAGANMAGQEVHYPGSLLMNILDVCGLQCASFGNWSDASAEAVTISDPAGPVFRRLLWTGDQITGAIFAGRASDLGMLNDIGMVKGIIQTRTGLGPWKEFLCENPFDIRRPYIATKVAEQLVRSTLVGRPARARQFRYGGVEPKPQTTPAHRVFVSTKNY